MTSHDRPTISRTGTQLLAALDDRDGGQLYEDLEMWNRSGGVVVEIGTPLILIVAGIGGRRRLTTLTRWRRQLRNIVWRYEPNTVGVTA